MSLRFKLVAGVMVLGFAGVFLLILGIFRYSRVIELKAGSELVPLSSETSELVTVSINGSAGGAPAGILAQVLNRDIEPQKPLENPPEIIKAVYATGWSAGSVRKMNYLIDLIKETELNALVIDIKDFSGYVLYNTDLEAVKNYNALEVRIPKINTLIKRLHDEGIYVIARLSVFQDPRLALARPDLALMSSSTGAVWQDNKGLAWIDPAARESWDYNIAIAKDVLARGFDEINFDYIRFASDGNLDDIVYPFWDGKTFKQEIIRQFFEYLRKELEGAVISADLFGLVTVDAHDMGIGQHLEYALPYFDYLSPMVYPSHYFKGFIGYQNPAQFPYEVVKYSLDQAIKRHIAYSKTQIVNPTSIQIASSTELLATSHKLLAKFRPWLQDFDLGADYNAEMVRKQIQAAYDAASSTPELSNGWMLWNPANIYTHEALEND